MNELSHSQTFGPPSRQVRRRAWTAAEYARMAECGVWADHDRIELLAGDIISMAAKGNRHEIVRTELTVHWADTRPPGIKFASEAPLWLDDRSVPEPDIILFPSAMKVTEVTGRTVLLVVEVADSSLSYDLEVKAPVYAAAGVREYWVIDTKTLDTTVHRDPSDQGYQSIVVVGPAVAITPLAAPEIAVAIGTLGLEPVA
ncbi:MAG: Uma2 family endonuclease [Hyphomicrobiaceae bacterium]|nr:Uma2 family endonuclease [Hyphomicrobiaceae bacterium]